MYRETEKHLQQWKVSPNRKPLLVRGARQVGKSYSIEKFGAEQFESLALVNFEQEPGFADCFAELKPQTILISLEVLLGVSIVPGKTLLFLDEVQQCPKAIMALRYFKEQLPELHVIAAGSFLELVIHDERYQQPVGRVESLYMKPCSFNEFLHANGDIKLLEFLDNINITSNIPTAIHNRLLERCRAYFVVGGMPEAVSYYVTQKKMLGIERIHASILEYYRRDFAKYHPKLNTQILEKIFIRTPGAVAKHFKYSDIDPDTRSRDQKPALDALIKSGVIHPVYRTSASGLPLHMGINEKKFKLLFLDVGLVQHETKLDKNLLLSENLILLNKGAIAEQFVGQELLSHGPVYEEQKLYYWARDKRGSQAEVDYVVTVGAEILPVEVKSGKTGRLKSLQTFMQEHNSKIGIRISQNELSFERNILSVPLYMVHQLERLVHTCISSLSDI